MHFLTHPWHSGQRRHYCWSIRDWRHRRLCPLSWPPRAASVPFSLRCLAWSLLLRAPNWMRKEIMPSSRGHSRRIPWLAWSGNNRLPGHCSWVTCPVSASDSRWRRPRWNCRLLRRTAWLGPESCLLCLFSDSQCSCPHHPRSSSGWCC